MQLAEVLKLKLDVTDEAAQAFADMCYQYMLACDTVSAYVFEHDFCINSVRAQLQFRGTKSAKRALRRISGRENRWMSDVNHQLSKTLVRKYGAEALFVLEDLKEVYTDARNLHAPEQSHDLRNWAFYDLETKLTYKAHEAGSEVLKVDAAYTSQRYPHCGQIHKENRDHKMHAYTCDRQSPVRAAIGFGL